jgi:hypothetical protein
MNILYTELVIKKKQLYEIEQQYQSFIETNHSIEYLFLGASAMHHAIDPREIPGSFNAGYFSETYIESYFKLRRMLEQDQLNIKVLVLEQDTNSLSGYMRLADQIPIEYDSWYYSQFMTLKEITTYTENNHLLQFLLTKFPVIGRGYDFSIIARGKTPVYLGWAGLERDFSTMDQFLSTKRVTEQFEGYNLQDPVLLEHYEKILSLAKTHNITLVLIRLPMSKSYQNELLELGIVREDHYAQLDARAQNQNISYQVLDYYDYFINQTDFFADPDHLNVAGTKALTKQVQEDLRSISSAQPFYIGRGYFLK